jgi:hypothetical protein
MVRVPRAIALLAGAATAVAVAPIALALSLAPATAGAAVVPAVQVTPQANSQWETCQATAAATAPHVLWTRIDEATSANKDIPASFWTNVGFRRDIAKIVCYESSFDYRANGGGQYGWFQMSKPLISTEGVTFYNYWNGNASEAAGWYQCLAGERYILGRYGTPAVAWQHEAVFGWY